jgi:hypothetical protein
MKFSLHRLIPLLSFLLNHLRLPSPDLDPVLFWLLFCTLPRLLTVPFYNPYAREVTQNCSKHIPVAVNKHTIIEEAVFSVGATPGLYNEYLTQLELEVSWVPELAVAAENWVSSCQLAE